MASAKRILLLLPSLVIGASSGLRVDFILIFSFICSPIVGWETRLEGRNQPGPSDRWRQVGLGLQVQPGDLLHGLHSRDWINPEVGMSQYLHQGIPYAEPPLGPLRFLPPVPHKPWTDPTNVTLPEKRCCVQITEEPDEDEVGKWSVCLVYQYSWH